MSERSLSRSRRGFLLAVGAGAAGAGAALAVRPLREAAPRETAPQPARPGYRVTAHIGKYYRTARM